MEFGGYSRSNEPMRTTPEQRHLMADAINRGKNINLVADFFGVCIRTVKRWINRKRYKDKPRKAKTSKITLQTELAILSMRTLFEWGSARIQQGLICLPGYAKKALQNTVENVRLSRAAINYVLKKHKLNGYKNNAKGWQFFRAEKPDELWQLDIKGPFTVQGKKYYFVICIDDHSRYLLLAEQLDHSPSIQEIASLLEPLVKKHSPKKILTDNNPFKDTWDAWCKGHHIEPLHAHPYYPQDKGKVERTIRNVAEEFVYLLKKFPEWLNGKIKEYQTWFNEKRMHRGIGTVPSALYH